MKFHLFENDAIEALFQFNNLAEFEQLWTIDSPWFEDPNYRRNGWSGVIKYALKDNEGNNHIFFIKRQENHNCKTFFHPFKGIPTFRREYFNLQNLDKKKIPSLKSAYYGERMHNGKAQSILITHSLESYQSFEAYFSNKDASDEQTDALIMQTAGENTRRLHDVLFRHGSLYPKHFFVKVDNGQVDVRLIDLEKLKWYPFSYLVRLNDLSRIVRRREPVSKTSIQLFINAYLTYGKDLSHSQLANQLQSLIEKH